LSKANVVAESRRGIQTKGGGNSGVIARKVSTRHGWLGVMMRNLVLNLADHNFAVAGYDKDPKQLEPLRKESGERGICGTGKIKDFIALLRKPRAVMMLAV
jgi:hypothetical protein